MYEGKRPTLPALCDGRIPRAVLRAGGNSGAKVFVSVDVSGAFSPLPFGEAQPFLSSTQWVFASQCLRLRARVCVRLRNA